MLDDWAQTVLTSATVTVVLSGVAAALFKSLLTERLKAAIKAEYDEKLESHKAQLQSSNSKELEVLKAQLKGHSDLELEQLKSHLQIQAAQQNLTFTRLHERRVEAIDFVHGKLIALRDAVGRYINAFQPIGVNDHDHLKAVEAAYSDFKPTFVHQQLFLPRNIASAVERLDATFLQVTNQFTIIVKADAKNPNTELWIKLLERFKTDVDEAIGRLHEDMRLALGDMPVETAG